MALQAEPLSSVPEHLRIRVIYDDDDIIVIDKPCNLRSVPGNATNTRGEEPSQKESRTESTSSFEDHSSLERLTAAEAWRKAILSFAAHDETERDEIDNVVARLGASESYVASIPRKFKTFQRYLKRNKTRLFMSTASKKCGEKRSIDDRSRVASLDTELDENLAKNMFQRIQERQRNFMNLPEPTKHEESALGQLILLGYAHDHIFTVHRLDCETSGVMMFARNSRAASLLSGDLRRRENIEKVYLAKVFDASVSNLVDPVAEASKDNPWRLIDLPLTPAGEGIKWKVCSETDMEGKESTTLWRFYEDSNGVWTNKAKSILELKPKSGRTHQLRVHCEARFGGIVGDSLYGKQSDYQEPRGDRLYLHAWKLLFLHPTKRTLMEFVSGPKWI